MAKQAALPKTEKTEIKKVDKPQSKDYIELKLPKIRFQDTPLSPLWVILLLIFSFLLGMSTMKLTYSDKALEKVLAQTQNGAQEAEQQGAALGQKVNVAVGKLPIQGNKNAKLTIIEFSDFQCPYCKRFYDETYAQIKKEYVDTGKAKIAYRHMPLASHPLAQDAGEASECANDQDEFWAYHDTLFDTYEDWASLTNNEAIVKFVSLAAEVGLNTQEFEACLTSNEHEQSVKDDMAAGSKAGVSGTPTFFINGKPLVGAHPFQTFKQLIDQELATL